jgi:hypothetical protein
MTGVTIGQHSFAATVQPQGGVNTTLIMNTSSPTVQALVVANIADEILKSSSRPYKRVEHINHTFY